MARFQAGMFLALLALAAGCRTSSPTQPSGEEPRLARPKAVRAEPFIQDVTAPPSEVKGFDLSGQVSCLPLADGRTCIARKDAVAEACAKAEGSASRCEDCRIVCDKPLAR